MAAIVSRWRALLDATPLAAIALTLMREATGREDPDEPLRPARAAALPARARVAFWSLTAGCGASTTAALVAHRSAGAGRAPLLVDLDRWAPSLAIRAKIEAATITDLLVQPGRERDLVSRWGDVPFIPGSPALHGAFAAERIAALLADLAPDRPVIADLGAGADALDPTLLRGCTRLCVIAGPSAGQLQALFCAAPLLVNAPCPIGLVIVGASGDDAILIARRAGIPLAGVIPHDAYLAEDAFGARAPTMRAVDGLIRSL